MKKVIIGILLLMPIELLAAGTSEGHDLDWAGLGWRILVFTIFIAILYKLLKEPVRNMLVKRTDDIIKALNQAELAKKEAQLEVKNYELKMIELEKELEEMKANSLKLIEKEKITILSDAERAVEKMKEFAKNSIEAEGIKLKASLKKEITLIAIAEAEKLLIKNTDSGSSEILSDYIKRIGA